MVKEVENDFELSDVFKIPSDSKTQNELTQIRYYWRKNTKVWETNGAILSLIEKT